MPNIKLPDGPSKITTGNDTMEFPVVKADDLIKIDRYNRRGQKKIGYIHKFMTRRV